MSEVHKFKLRFLKIRAIVRTDWSLRLIKESCERARSGCGFT